MAEAGVDVLTGRYDFTDEEIHVFRPIAEPPFNHTGRLHCENS